MPSPYEAPIDLMRLALDQACAASGANAIDGYAETLCELATPILESASRFAGEILSPLNPIGDRTHSRCGPEGVVTPPGFPDAYRRFREDGWVSLSAPTEYGGQGLPGMLSVATGEMWAGANMAFAMCPELAVGALEAMRVHAPQALRDEYMPLIASGEWTSSMCLTEPQAGSDLSTIRTRAEPDGETWRLFGRKIYISWGDHDLTDNIVHFVLARTPDAPAGTKGISLFLVPKKIRSADGGQIPNDIHAVSVENKMGIHASPTCVMALGEGPGARGWLIGKLHEGLACMFTIMNHMRIGVGTHSIGLAERGLQLARHHARERLQGRNQAGAQRPIIEHADVRRMLLTMKSLIHAARCLTYVAAATVDVAHCAADEGKRAAAARRAELLTPIVKAWVSDVGFEAASLGVQVHGGTGYIDDAEISQVFRDSRIGSIFEGTNYIQAQDLVGRKILRDRGVALEEFLRDVEAAAGALPADPAHPLRSLREGLIEGCADIRSLTADLMNQALQDREIVGSIAYDYLNCLGVLAGGWQWALTAAQAISATTGTSGSTTLERTAAFYGARVLPRVKVHSAAVRSGSDPVMGVAVADL
ncbi:MAG TPA: acyl-CoA dehydrogenase [Steroidobacteraceae bacterium]|jgi:acyl-CoA dehydrogenase